MSVSGLLSYFLGDFAIVIAVVILIVATLGILHYAKTVYGVGIRLKNPFKKKQYGERYGHGM